MGSRKRYRLKKHYISPVILVYIFIMTYHCLGHSLARYRWLIFQPEIFHPLPRIKTYRIFLSFLYHGLLIPNLLRRYVHTPKWETLSKKMGKVTILKN